MFPNDIWGELSCCVFGQLFKGMLYHCVSSVSSEAFDVSDVNNKTDCMNKGAGYRWVNRKYNFDNLGQVSGVFKNSGRVFGCWGQLIIWAKRTVLGRMDGSLSRQSDG